MSLYPGQPSLNQERPREVSPSVGNANTTGRQPDSDQDRCFSKLIGSWMFLSKPCTLVVCRRLKDSLEHLDGKIGDLRSRGEEKE